MKNDDVAHTLKVQLLIRLRWPLQVHTQLVSTHAALRKLLAIVFIVSILEACWCERRRSI